VTFSNVILRKQTVDEVIFLVM